ncbi:MAG: hypothetical protein NZ870_00640 [bacterium]|nr:hypothetical protein [bacterium]
MSGFFINQLSPKNRKYILSKGRIRRFGKGEFVCRSKEKWVYFFYTF